MFYYGIIKEYIKKKKILPSKLLILVEALLNLKVKNEIAILCVHYFQENFDENTVKDQIHFLKKYCNVISFKEAMNLVENKLYIPKNTVVIIVDDSTKFFYNSACPLLIQSGLPFTMAIIPGLIKSNKKEHLISRLMRIAGHEYYLSNEQMIKRVSDRFEVYGIGKVNSFEQIYNKAINLSEDNLLDVINYMNVPDHEFLSWNYLRKLKNFKQIDFASHTMGHPYLKFAKGTWLDWELGKSKSLIEEQLDINIDSLVIPYGSIDNVTDELKNSLEKHGYKYSIHNEKGTVNYNTNLYMIPRMSGDVMLNTFKVHCCPAICKTLLNKCKSNK